MTITSKLFSLVLIAFVFTACQKEISPDELPDARPTNPATSDSVRLKLYVELDTLRTSGTDTILKFNVDYDAQKRLLNFEMSEYDYYSGELWVITKYSFKYSGSDTLPELLTLHGQIFSNGTVSHLKDTVNCVYDNAGNLIKVYQEGVDLADSFNAAIYYYPSYAKSILYINGVLQPDYDSIVNKLTLFGGNITNSSQEVHRFEPMYYRLTREGYASTYDQQKNPFRRFLRLFEILQINFAQLGYFGGHSLSANNVIQFSGTFYSSENASDGTDQYNASYTYNNAGYPVTCRFRHTDWGNGVNEGKKLYFYY